MPLGKEVGLGPGHIVLDGDPIGDPAPHSSPCLLWPKGRPSQQLLSSGPTKSRPEPSGYRPEPSGRRLDQSRVESVQDQHETCDALLRFAIYSRISFCITWSDIIFLIFTFVLHTTKLRYWASSQHVIFVRFIPFWTFNSWITGGVRTARDGF